MPLLFSVPPYVLSPGRLSMKCHFSSPCSISGSIVGAGRRRWRGLLPALGVQTGLPNVVRDAAALTYLTGVFS